jgi:broad specificity phosphatase PhoE
LLARHGQSLWNQVRKFQGANDVGLSDLGRTQAVALGSVLRAGYRVSAAYVSPMSRALDTAEIALQGTGIPLTPVGELRELSLGDWEGCTVDEVRGREGNPYLSWVRAPLDCPPPGGEPLLDVCARVRRAIDRIAANHRDGEDVLVVAHGGVISVYLCHLLGVSFNHLWRMRIDNCSLTIARPPRLVSVNDTAHLLSIPSTRWFEVSEAGRDPGGVPPTTTLAPTRGDRFPGSAVGSTLTTRVAGSTPPGSRPASDTCPASDTEQAQ